MNCLHPDSMAPVKRTKSMLALLGWLALTFCAAATGVFVKTGGWYATLAKLAAFLRVKRLAGMLLVPYTLWVTFATLLNYTIWRMNG